MKIRGIRLQNVRQFVDPVEILGIGDGLNVLTAPNEYGKSTFFDALHAAFFKDRKSWDKEIRAMVPHAGGDPSIAVEIEHEEDVFQIEKRWNRSNNGEVRITSQDRLIKQADEAQAWIDEVLKSPKDGGPASLLWVRQGKSGLDEGGNTQYARQDLVTSVSGEIESITGGKRLENALNRCTTELERYLTPNRRVRQGGQLKRAKENTSETQRRKDELKGKSDALHEDLDARKKFIRQLSELEDPVEEETRNRRQEEARVLLDEAMRHHDLLERARDLEQRRHAELQVVQTKFQTLERNLAELEEAEEALEIAQQDETIHRSKLNNATTAATEAERVFKGAQESFKSATEVLLKSIRIREAKRSEDRRRELNERLERAELLRQECESATAQIKIEVSEDDLNEIEKLDEEVRVNRRTLELRAPRITMQYAEDRNGNVSIEGAVLPDRQPRAITEIVELQIDRMGRLVIDPGSQKKEKNLTESQKRLDEALRILGFESLAQARGSGIRRTEAEERQQQALAELNGIDPNGIDSLRQELVSLPEVEKAPDDHPSEEQAKSAESDANEKLAIAGEELERRKRELAVQDAQAEFTVTNVEAAKSRRDKAAQSLCAYRQQLPLREE